MFAPACRAAVEDLADLEAVFQEVGDGTDGEGAALPRLDAATGKVLDEEADRAELQTALKDVADERGFVFDVDSLVLGVGHFNRPGLVTFDM
jgi:hypothetical protein